MNPGILMLDFAALQGGNLFNLADGFDARSLVR
jgi:hypothetical protein